MMSHSQMSGRAKRTGRSESNFMQSAVLDLEIGSRQGRTKEMVEQFATVLVRVETVVDIWG